MNTPRKTKVAILGGGVGSMTTAFWLTSQPGWQDRYEVTLYQMGWRLGGKGASGRNPDPRLGQRIEEHGLHIWFGFYQNAFRTMLRCYEELVRPPGSPLSQCYARTPEDEANPDNAGVYAFRRHDTGTLEDLSAGRWNNWSIPFPLNTDLPGTGDSGTPSFLAIAEMADAWIHRALRTLDLGFLGGLGLIAAWEVVSRLLKAFPHHLSPDSLWAREIKAALAAFVGLLRHFLDRADLTDARLRRTFIIFDFAATTLIGLIEDGVFGQDLSELDKLDQWDICEWLRRHGAHFATTDPTSPFMRGFYEIPFAFEAGDPKRPNLAAGAALRCILRIAFGYKGCLMWKMQAGMGDTIFTPIYQVLKQRGVHFEFFHRVDHLAVGTDDSGAAVVDRIDFTRQATVRGGGEYQPLRSIRDLDCWPSLPDFSQLVEGDQIRKGPAGGDEPYDLESYWTPWPGVGKRSLVRGTDFDVAVLGIPVAAHTFLAAELMAANPAFDRMVREVKTTRTLAFQLWFKDPWSALGWDGEQGVIMDGYFDPFNTMSDMSHLLPREQWDGASEPGSVVYFCGPMKDDPQEPGFDQPDYPATQWKSVRTQAESFLDAHSRHLFPAAIRKDSTESLDYARLFDAAEGSGTARLDAQFFRCNIDPNERYVLSVKGSTQFRLRADESGFGNLILAGDWTLNGLNVGCVEASVMSGMQAARVINGTLDTPIDGDLPPRAT